MAVNEKPPVTRQGKTKADILYTQAVAVHVGNIEPFGGKLGDIEGNPEVSTTLPGRVIPGGSLSQKPFAVIPLVNEPHAVIAVLDVPPAGPFNHVGLGIPVKTDAHVGTENEAVVVEENQLTGLAGNDTIESRILLLGRQHQRHRGLYYGE